MPSLFRLRTVAALVVVGGLTACGPSAGETASETAVPGATPGAEQTRLVEHAMGSTEVPGDVERVVVLDSPHLDAALSLGVTPVGSVQSDVAAGLPAYLGDRTEGIEVVGTIQEPSLEAISELDPDLILSAQVRSEQIYDRLSQIAPTVLTDYEDGWEENFLLIAESLGRQEEGEQALADYGERAAQIGEEINAGDTTASIVRFLPDETRIYGPGTFSGSVLTDIGLQLPELEYDEYGMVYISPEQIELADADAIFHTAYGDPAQTTRGSVTSLWGNLAAVQAGCEFAVEDDEWMLGIGLIGAGIILDEVEESLSGNDCG